MNTVSVQTSPSLLNSQELSKATRYLTSTRNDLHAAVTGLSDGQWHFKAAPDRWSIAEVLEHLVLIEDRVHAIVDRMQDAPPPELDRIDLQIEETILTQVPKRSIKVQAPPPVLPSRRWSAEETLARFLESRGRTLELLVAAPSLRGHVVPHPILGACDGYQWILAAAAHSARHTGQILEVKSSSGFPETHAASSVSPH